MKDRNHMHVLYLSVDDDLVNEGGIMDLWIREARIFKYGSGVGTNFSKIRGANEKLSGGGNSSGLMSFLKLATVQPVLSNQEEPHAVRPKWFVWIWTIRK
jgi:ribonucleotide reductase alpha subunit